MPREIHETPGLATTRDIMPYVRTERLAAGMSQTDLCNAVQARTGLTLTLSRYKALESSTTAGVTLTQELIKAFEITFDLPAGDLATPEELSTLRPRERRQHLPTLTGEPLPPSAQTHLIARRMRAFREKYGWEQSCVGLCNRMKRQQSMPKHSLQPWIVRRYMGDAHHKITLTFVRAVARAIDPNDPDFDHTRFLICDHRCPHCFPILKVG